MESEAIVHERPLLADSGRSVSIGEGPCFTPGCLRGAVSPLLNPQHGRNPEGAVGRWLPLAKGYYQPRLCEKSWKQLTKRDADWFHLYPTNFHRPLRDLAHSKASIPYLIPTLPRQVQAKTLPPALREPNHCARSQRSIEPGRPVRMEASFSLVQPL